MTSQIKKNAIKFVEFCETGKARQNTHTYNHNHTQANSIEYGNVEKFEQSNESFEQELHWTHCGRREAFILVSTSGNHIECK